MKKSIENKNKKIINDENIIYNELIKLSSSLSKYITENVDNLKYLINFFNTISIEFNNFGKDVKFPNFSSNLSFFYESQKSIIEKIKQISNLIKNDIIDPLIIFKDSYEKDNRDIIFSLSQIMEEICKHQNILNDVQKNYYYKYKDLNDKDSLMTEDKYLLENNYYNIYFNEYDSMNKILNSLEKKYINIKQRVFSVEKEKNNIILNKINEYLKIINNQILLYKNSNNETINKNIYGDNKFIERLFEGNRILTKEWIQDIKLGSFNDNFYSQNNNIKNSSLNEFNINKNKDYDKIINNNIINSYIIINNNIFKDKYYKKIQDFYLALKSENSLENNLLKEINEMFKENRQNNKFYELFLSLFNESIKKDNSSLFIFKTFSNLVYLTNIINNIIEDIKDKLLLKENRDYYKIFDQIILIGENSVYDNTFMCSLLNKNKIFRNILVWKSLIFNKIILYLNKISKNFEKEDDFNSLNIKNIKDIKDNIIKIALKVKNNINLINDYKSIIESTGLSKYIQNYNQLSESQKEYLNEKYCSEILNDVIKANLRHMGNYNYILENPSDINDIILNDLNIENEQQIDFFIKYYSVCINTNKKEKSKNIYGIKNRKLKDKISLIRNKKNDLINKKYPCNFTQINSKYIILKNVSKYLNEEDNIKLFHLNKNLLKLNKVYYKKILKEKNVPIRKRINIWKSLLKCNTYYSVFNYNNLILQINNHQIINEDQKIMEQIIKDLKRTKYRLKESPAALFNLLRCFAYSNNNINYYQGMNLLSLFVFEITKSEEETFIILNNLFYFTQFGDIIENDFQKLKIFYYIIERLIYLYLPRIYTHLKDNQIKVIYFINPYFITLFTNIYVYLPDNEIKFLLYVWDNFILNGWKNIFEIFLTIFKYYEKKILELKGDDILAFLANDLAKSEIFFDENLEKFLELQKIFKLNDGLINLIEKEILLEMDFRSLTSSKIIEYENNEEKISNYK